MISEEKYEIISHSEPILIENYFNKVFHQLPPEVYQEIVEKENELNIYQYPDPILISDLSNLYQMAVETFSGAFDNKADFFKRKLEKLNYYFTINKKKNMFSRKDDNIISGDFIPEEIRKKMLIDRQSILNRILVSKSTNHDNSTINVNRSSSGILTNISTSMIFKNKYKELIQNYLSAS